MSVPAHSVTFTDGTNVLSLSPEQCDFDGLNYDWAESGGSSSFFHAHDGSTQKQVNAGASAKARLSVTVAGFKPSALWDFDYAVTWDVTIADRDDPTQSKLYTMWPVGLTPIRESFNAVAARHAWRMEFIDP